MTRKPLTRVRRASLRRATATQDYMDAILAARAAGHSMPEIGEAAGITKQGVRYLIEKGKT